MPPVFSRPCGTPRFPADVLLDIIPRVPRGTQHAMLLSSWALHDLVAPILYRSMAVLFDHPRWGEKGWPDHYPLNLLGCLLLSLRHSDRKPWHRCYVYHIVTFSYVSYSTKADRRAIPMLGEILRFCRVLRHLRIDVEQGSVDLTIDIFTRKSLIRIPTSPVVSVAFDCEPCDLLLLPRLQSIRSSSAIVTEALMRYRRIATVVIDDIPPRGEVLNNLLAIGGPVQARFLTRLSLPFYQDGTVVEGVLCAIATTFPYLEHLSVYCVPAFVGRLFSVCARTL
ncbi:hypothetical protein OH77DRAFT_1395373 [Trametes cingulata]|nr:hypothetical protein OH77DRAFT_1395373 [Trametes cingulata]